MSDTAKPRPAPRPLNATGIGLVLLTTVLWGANPVAVSFSVDSLPPIAVAGLRFVMAAIFMVGWCVVERSPLVPRRNQWGIILAAGLLLFLQIGTFNIGVSLSNSSHSSLLINTYIFWVVAIEHWITRTDRLTGARLAGLLIAALGALVMLIATTGEMPSLLPADVPSLTGDLVLMLSALILGVKIIYVKHVLKRIDTGTLILWHDVVGVLLFAAASGLFEEVRWTGITAPAVWGLLFQGVLVAGLCFGIQARLLTKHSGTQIAVFSFLTPLVGVLCGIVFRGDPLSPWLLVSAVCVAVGILLVNLRQK